MYINETKLRVRYGETDRMGYAYYGNYAEYFEVARVECLRNLGFPYKELEDEGILLPVLDYKVKYLKPALYDDELTIRTYIKDVPKVRIHFEYEVFNQAGEKLNIGETTLVFVDSKTRKPRMAPEDLVKALKEKINE